MEKSNLTQPCPVDSKPKHLRIDAAILSVSSSIDNAQRLVDRVNGEGAECGAPGEKRPDPSMLEVLETAAERLHIAAKRLDQVVNELTHTLFE